MPYIIIDRFGDNDVDGVTSTTLLYQFFEYIGANVRYFLPRRKEDGHGFNDDTLYDQTRNGVAAIFSRAAAGKHKRAT